MARMMRPAASHTVGIGEINAFDRRISRCMSRESIWDGVRTLSLGFGGSVLGGALASAPGSGGISLLIASPFLLVAAGVYGLSVNRQNAASRQITNAQSERARLLGIEGRP